MQGFRTRDTLIVSVRTFMYVFFFFFEEKEAVYILNLYLGLGWSGNPRAGLQYL